MTEPRPCPFCECETIWTFHYGHFEHPWVCECVRCFARGPHGSTEEEAVELWNRRTEGKHSGIVLCAQETKKETPMQRNLRLSRENAKYGSFGGMKE